MSKAFASRGDLAPKTVSFTQLAENAWAYTAEGDPNTGVIIGDDCVMVLDAQATPVMAQDVIAKIRTVTDKPIKHVVLTHYHAVRVLGASGYGASNIIASEDTRDLIVERGQQDYQSEFERFPRLFQAIDSVPGLTWPNIVFRDAMTVWLGKTEVRLLQVGRGTPKATPSPGCRRSGCFSAVIWWNSVPRPTPATPISGTGRPRWTGLPHSSLARWCPVAVMP